MEIGFIVGIIISVLVLIIGIIGILLSKKSGVKNKWAWWAVVFGVCALISAVINLKIFL